MATVSVRHVWKRYGDQVVLENLNVEVADHEFVTIVGASGCGKSTFLRLLLGTEQPSRGSILIDGEPVRPEPDPTRGIVFQRYSLFPHLTAIGNLVLGLELKRSRLLGRLFGAKRRQAMAQAEAMLEQVGLAAARDRYPAQLSGGMQQRLAIAQAVIAEPRILLLDEPFGALDALTRAHLQDEVIRIQSELGSTVMMITHDVDEAVLLSDRIVMMTNGPSATIGEILDIDLERPRDRLALSDDARYNHYRHEVLSFLHEKQRKVEPMARAGARGKAPEALSA